MGGLLAGWGLALLLKDAGSTTAAARVGGVAYALSGPLLSLGNLPNLMGGVAWVPLILWAGGLYGLNSICKSSLSQAAGAVLGAARAVEAPPRSFFVHSQLAFPPIVCLWCSCLAASAFLVPPYPSLTV